MVDVVPDDTFCFSWSHLAELEKHVGPFAFFFFFLFAQALVGLSRHKCTLFTWSIKVLQLITCIHNGQESAKTVLDNLNRYFL